MYVRIYMYMYVCMYVYIRTCMYVCTYIYVHICMYVCIYIYMYIHVYILTRISYHTIFLSLKPFDRRFSAQLSQLISQIIQKRPKSELRAGHSEVITGRHVVWTVFVLIEQNQRKKYKLASLLSGCVCMYIYLHVHTCVYSHAHIIPSQRGGGLGSSTIFKKFNEPYAPS